jgi:hypothetical protein
VLSKVGIGHRETTTLPSLRGKDSPWLLCEVGFQCECVFGEVSKRRVVKWGFNLELIYENGDSLVRCCGFCVKFGESRGGCCV